MTSRGRTQALAWLSLNPRFPQFPAARAAQLLRQHGPIEFGRRATRRAIEELKPLPRWEGVWVWYELDLTSPQRPRPPLQDGLELRRAGPQDLPLLAEVPASPWVTPMTEELVARRLAAGATLWLVLQGDELAYFCWSFRGQGPLYGARRDRLTLPPDVVWPDDQLTLPAFRGRRIAPATLSAIGDDAARSGARALVGRVHVPNTPSRRMMERAGWRPIALMQVVERDWRRRIRVVFLDDEPAHPWLASLHRG